MVDIMWLVTKRKMAWKVSRVVTWGLCGHLWHQWTQQPVAGSENSSQCVCVCVLCTTVPLEGGSLRVSRGPTSGNTLLYKSAQQRLPSGLSLIRPMLSRRRQADHPITGAMRRQPGAQSGHSEPWERAQAFSSITAIGAESRCNPKRRGWHDGERRGA